MDYYIITRNRIRQILNEITKHNLFYYSILKRLVILFLCSIQPTNKMSKITQKKKKKHYRKCLNIFQMRQLP